jgi:hypothetical protein
MVLLTAEQEMDGFIQRELNNNSDNIEMNSPTDSSDSELLLSKSSSSSSSTSSSFSSSSSSGIQITNISSNSEEHAIVIAETAALLQVVMETCIHNPHKIAKLSSFNLVFVEFKINNPKCFFQNPLYNCFNRSCIFIVIQLKVGDCKLFVEWKL